MIIIAEEAAPATPASGKVVFYAKADGRLYAKDDAGTELLIGFTSPLGVAEGGTGAVSQAAARAALDVPSNAEAILDSLLTATGDIIAASAANTPSRVAAAAAGYALTSRGAGILPGWSPPSSRIERIINGEIIASYAGNAVTYTLKGKAGADLSATNPCFLFFNSTTVASADIDIVKVTANISITVSSGSTLGHASAIPQYTFIYALNNAGVAELAVSSLPPDYPGIFGDVRLFTTTAEGGAGAADSPTGIYSAAARVSYSWIPIAKVKDTQTVAGTWAASPTQIDMAPFSLPLCAFRAFRNTSSQTLTNNVDTKAQLNGETFDIDATFDSVTNYRHQPNVPGLYKYEWHSYLTAIADGAYVQISIYKNGTGIAVGLLSHGAAQDRGSDISDLTIMNGTTDYIEFYIKHVHGSDRSMNASSVLTFASGKRES